jgi:hypothetical protein
MFPIRQEASAIHQPIRQAIRQPDTSPDASEGIEKAQETLEPQRS